MPQIDPAPRETGTDVLVPIDVPCAGCGYDLRGLTVPRCPECGSEFNPAELLNRQEKPTFWEKYVVWLLVGAVFFFMSFIVWPLLALEIPIIAFFTVSGIQALIEVLTARWWISPLTWRKFRAWWEGVLIGYGLCAATQFTSGYCISLFEHGSWPTKYWPVFLLTAVEALVVQYLVVRARSKRWELGLSATALLAGCAAAKLVAELIWAALPFSVWRVPGG